MALDPVSVPVGSEPEGWRHARLIPTLGTRNQQEQEKRATSCLLAVMYGVPEFGHALLKELGAPKSPVIETFAEVRFKNEDGKTVIPDGAIVCRRGSKRWGCLVEVKTGSAQLKEDQVSSYLDIAREHGFDGVLTISSQISASSSESPVVVDKRKLRKTCLWHLSWWRVLTEAVVQQRYRGVSDPDQEWVLRELIHYLSSDASGALEFEDMGPDWVPVRKAAHDGTLRSGDSIARSVAERWEQFTNYLALRLSQELGASVVPHRPRSQTTSGRMEEIVNSLASAGELRTTLRIPDAIGPLEIDADLRSRQTFTSVSIDAPREGTHRRRFGWLMRQLKDAPDGLRLEAAFPNARSTTAATLGDIRADPRALEYPHETRRPPRLFVVTVARPMGQKRGREEGSFVRETSAQVVDFYREIVQNLKPWQAPAPKVHSVPDPAEEGNVGPASNGLTQAERRIDRGVESLEGSAPVPGAVAEGEGLGEAAVLSEPAA